MGQNGQTLQTFFSLNQQAYGQSTTEEIISVVSHNYSQESLHFTFFVFGGCAAKSLFEELRKVFGVLEADLVGNFGDIAPLLADQLTGSFQAHHANIAAG